MVYSFTSADCEVFLQTDRQKPRLVSSTGLEEMAVEVRVLYFSKQRTPQPLSHLLNRGSTSAQRGRAAVQAHPRGRDQLPSFR